MHARRAHPVSARVCSLGKKVKSMKILMIAPQPFLEERGAPFAIYHHIRALISMGHEIDLVTYHIGKPVGGGQMANTLEQKNASYSFRWLGGGPIPEALDLRLCGWALGYPDDMPGKSISVVQLGTVLPWESGVPSPPVTPPARAGA